MDKSKNISSNFKHGLEKLGFSIEDDAFYFSGTTDKNINPQLFFHIERSKTQFFASAVYFRKQTNGSYKPQVLIYDFTDRNFNSQQQDDLRDIQRKIWSSGEVPLACIFYKTEIKILNCSTHLNSSDYSPVHLVKDLNIVDKAEKQHSLFNKEFALSIKTGIFWDEEENKNRFKFRNSAYDRLIDNIRYLVEVLTNQLHDVQPSLVNKIIIQSILIKYLEERIDSNGDRLLTEKYFKKYNKSNSFIEIIRNRKFSDLLIDLNKDFNGNVFKWSDKEQLELNKLDLNVLADLLDTNKVTLRTDQIQINFLDWRYFEFKYIPVELISRLYEEFLSSGKKEEGIYYTPAHLAQLLIDELIPLDQYEIIDPFNYKVLDPACGSGIFLVISFKRLVQIWRLRNNARPTPEVLKKILSNIYGVDKKEQAISLASFSLALALCNELDPLIILNKLKFDDLKKINLIESDFFDEHLLKNFKFDVIVGNPPFVRGGIRLYGDNFWSINNHKVKIPSGQIALKFLVESINYLKPNGLQCLIIKSTSLLFGNVSEQFKEVLFSELNVIQVFDFTSLARNGSLWDNGADVAAAAIFIKNEKPKLASNILHVTFRRTAANKDRIVFEIDDYDLHFIDRITASMDPFIWKINLLGGGRIKNIIRKLNQSYESFESFLNSNHCISGEGFIKGKNGKLKPKFIYEIPTLPTEAVRNNRIDYSQLHSMNKGTRFVKIPNESLFQAPNILFW